MYSIHMSASVALPTVHGWEGLLVSRCRCLGSLSKILSNSLKVGRFSGSNAQHIVNESFTSLETSILASDCLTPFPTCQIIASGISFLNGHEPEHISYHTVPKAYMSVAMVNRDESGASCWVVSERSISGARYGSHPSGIISQPGLTDLAVRPATLNRPKSVITIRLFNSRKTFLERRSVWTIPRAWRYPMPWAIWVQIWAKLSRGRESFRTCTWV